MNSFEELIKQIDAFIWGVPLLVLLLGAGIILTFKLTGFQVRQFGFAMKNTFGKMFDKSEYGEGTVTPFQALSTALAATVGTGNIVGVTVALLTGGPGAIFWMWIAAFFGMATKYAEVTLSIAYRIKKENGEYAGGPMYYIDKGMKLPWLGKLFALFAGIATFGIGNSVQSNSIAGVLNANFGLNPIVVGAVLTILVAIVILGGIKSISKVTEKIVPFMAVFYILGALIVIIVNRANLLPALASIFQNAFSYQAAAGGAVGFGLVQIMRAGISRGVFTNEAGLGSSPIAHASATTDHPVRQGLWGVSEVFIDTFFVCTMTALVVLTSGIVTGPDADASAVVAQAFGQSFAPGKYIVTLGLVLFAFSTILGWEYYGETSIRYLLGEKAGPPFKVIYIIFVFVGSTIELGTAWDVANILNGLMAFPNLIGLIGLSGVVVKLTKDFFEDPDRIRTSPEEYKHLLK